MRLRIKNILRKLRYNPKRSFLFMFLFLSLVSLTVGYAFLTTTMSIDGVSKMLEARWDVHFANVVTKQGSVTPTEGPTITDPTTLTFSAQLENPGDFFEFTVDVVNAGTLDAHLYTINLEFLPTLNLEQLEYMDYDISYADGMPINEGDALNAGETETILISFKYLDGKDSSVYPINDENYSISISFNYVQGTGNIVDHPDSFEDDSWKTIASYASLNRFGDFYEVGETRTITLGNGLGTHTLRIANISKPDECLEDNFSKSACGVVIEFADIITEQPFGVNYVEPVDWAQSPIGTYVNETIYNALPSDLREFIVDTTVFSGATRGSNRYVSETTNYLYLLSSKEIYGVGLDDFLPAEQTRQLDYYANLPVTSTSYSGAIKMYNGVAKAWWARGSNPNSSNSGKTVTAYGDFNVGRGSPQYSSYGVSPAFRILNR